MSSSSAVTVTGEKVEEVRTPFKKARLDNIIPEAFKVHQTNACSSCMNAFLLSCRLLEGRPTDPIHVYLGSSVPGKLPDGLKVGFGNCCPKETPFDRRIRGCPPYPFLLRECLREGAESKE